MYLVEVSTAIVSFVFGILVLYLTAYSKAKGKNRALEEDVSRLEDEKQKIIAKGSTINNFTFLLVESCNSN